MEPGHHGFGHASRAAKRVYALRAREPFSAKMTLLRGFPPRKDHDAAHIASSEERRLRQQLVAPAARWRGWTTASISVAQHQSHGPSTAHVIFYSGSLATQGRTMRDKIRYNICGSPYDLKKIITSTRGVADFHGSEITWPL